MDVLVALMIDVFLLALLVGGPAALCLACLRRYRAAASREQSIYRVLIGASGAIALFNLALILFGSSADNWRALAWGATLLWIVAWCWLGLRYSSRRRRLY